MRITELLTITGALAATGAGAAPAPPSQAFSIQAYSTDPTLNGSYAVEQHSTNSGRTPIILSPPSAANPLRMENMFLLDDSVAVPYPLRSGGSEYDYLVMGEVNSTTGVGFVEVVPAGYGNGWEVIYYDNPTVKALVYKDAGGQIGTGVACATAFGGVEEYQLGFYLRSNGSRLPDTCEELLWQAV